MHEQLIGGDAEEPLFPPQYDANPAGRGNNEFRVPLLEGEGAEGGAQQPRGNWLFSVNANGTYNVMCLRQLTREFMYTVGLLFVLAVIIVIFVVIA